MYVIDVNVSWIIISEAKAKESGENAVSIFFSFCYPTS